MPRTTLAFAIASTISLFGGHGAVAQNSTAAPLSATKEDSTGDPSGAIRALEKSSEGQRSPPVTIPKLDGEKASRASSGPQDGTSGKAN